MTAAYAGRIAVVELLLKYNADPNLRTDLNARRQTDRDGNGPAPIHMALGQSHDDVAIALIEAGASVDIEYTGRTVLQYAEWCECASVVNYLRQSGVRR